MVVILEIFVVVTTKTLNMAGPARIGSDVDLSSTIPEYPQRLVSLGPPDHQEESYFVDNHRNIGVIMRDTHRLRSTTIVGPGDLSVFEHGVGGSVEISCSYTHNNTLCTSDRV